MLALQTALLGAWLSASPTVPPPSPESHELRFSLLSDGLITGVAAMGWLVSETAEKSALAPATCRWCEDNAFDRFGRGVHWSPQEQGTADSLSNVAGFAAVPLTVIGLQSWLAVDFGAARKIPEDLLIIGESAMLALVVNQGVKFAAGRERPFVHALLPGQKPLTKNPSDNNLSFFSGHTTFTFSLVVAAGTVAGQRGYRGSALIWGVGLPLAATTAYFRMAADRHYLSDVLVGMAVGSAFGVGVPLLLHPRVEGPGPSRATVRVRLLPSADGAALVGSF